MATSGEKPQTTISSVTITGALPAGANNIGSVNVASLPALAAGANAIGSVTVTSLPALPAGTNVIGHVIVDTLPALPAGSNLIGQVQEVPGTSGGLSAYSVISLATTNGANVKASAGQIYVLIATNINAAVRYLKLYNKATAPVVGTDTPVARFAIPGNAGGAGFVIPIPDGLAFAAGIGVGLTTGSADGDTGAVAAGDIIVNVLYK